jgi:hypothetical protein
MKVALRGHAKVHDGGAVVTRRQGVADPGTNLSPAVIPPAPWHSRGHPGRVCPVGRSNVTEFDPAIRRRRIDAGLPCPLVGYDPEAIA